MDSQLTWGFMVLAGAGLDYAKMRGMLGPIRVKASRLVGVGSVSMGTSVQQQHPLRNRVTGWRLRGLDVQRHARTRAACDARRP
jgi:hypothetical protein